MRIWRASPFFILTALIGILIIVLAGCTIPGPNGPRNDGTRSTIDEPSNEQPVPNAPQANQGYQVYETQEYVLFTDPKEGAFSFEVPQDWTVTSGSGLIRPYIDAGISLHASNSKGQEFFYQDPYGYVYANSNQLLDYAGFTEGSLYDPSGGVTQPMKVKRYTNASDMAREILSVITTNPTNILITDRADLTSPVPWLNSQSAAELSFDYTQNGVAPGRGPLKAAFIVRTGLSQLSGTGIWSVSLSGFSSPPELMNETEIAILNMQRTFKVNQTWAARESQAIKERAKILGQAQVDVSGIISTTFEARSKSMDRLNQQWDNYILGVEDVYDSSSGQHYVVESGSKYYWMDAQGKVYGTNTNENPIPNKNLKPLRCPGC